MKRTTKSIQAEIAKGAFRPHTALSTMALAYYQQETTSFAKNMFPVCPVQLSSDNYYVFDKEDLLRDNWNRKPAYGSVDPAVISEHTENYACHVDQMMMGIDNIRQTDLNRRQGPHTKDPRQQRTKVIATQANIHQDAEFSKSFMRKGVWKNEATGTDSVSVTSGQFIKFSNGNSDPIAFFQNKMTEINEETGRTPNRLGLGVNVYNVAVNEEDIPAGFAEKKLDRYIETHKIRGYGKVDGCVKRVACDERTKEYIQLQAVKLDDDTYMVQEFDNELVFMGELWSGCKYPDEVIDWMKSNYEIESCLTAEVYRSSLGDCTNNGISSYARELYILDTQKGPFEPDDIRQCVYIEKREVMGQEYVDCKPAYCRKRWYMAGGNILYTSDSRFKQITGISYPIAIHDRYEGR